MNFMHRKVSRVSQTVKRIFFFFIFNFHSLGFQKFACEIQNQTFSGTMGRNFFIIIK